jgi:hypothetical protein
LFENPKVLVTLLAVLGAPAGLALVIYTLRAYREWVWASPVFALVLLWLLRPSFWKGLAVTGLTIAAVVALNDSVDLEWQDVPVEYNRSATSKARIASLKQMHRLVSIVMAFQVLLAAVILSHLGVPETEGEKKGVGNQVDQSRAEPVASADRPRE